MRTNEVNNSSFIINPSLKIDHVDLKVSNLKESINFYQSILGFRVLKDKSTSSTAFLAASSSSSSVAIDNINTTLSSENKEKVSPLLVLTEIDKNNDDNTRFKNIKKESGLFHFAILLPERKFLAAFLRHIQKNLYQTFFEGTADHAVSESIYIHDLDYNGIEVYRDKPSSEWKWNGDKVHMVTEPLDIQNLFNQNPYERWSGLPPATTIGHVHLHVSNLNRSREFYHNIFGLYHTASFPGALFFAADHYHHHIATNTWLGTNIAQANNNNSKPGLAHYTVRLPNNKKEIDELKDRFIKLGLSVNEIAMQNDIQQKQQQPSSFYVFDPDRIKIQF
ncbi:MAG: VOC family protein, partial [Candidatus Nitrosocosmicus sp.]